MAKTMMTKTREQAKERSDGFAGIDETTKLSISVMGGISALVGIWAAACLITAMMGVGGPLELVQSWFSAVTGV